MKVIKFAPGLIPVLKHEQHDQKTHGNWAGVGGMATQGKELLSAEQIKEIESILTKIPADHLEALVASGTKVRIMDSPKVMNPDEAPHFHRADNEIRLDKNSGVSALLHEIGHALDFNAKSGDGFLSDDPNFRKIIKDSKFPNFSSRNSFAKTEEFAVAYENFFLDGGEFIGAKPTKEFKQVMDGIGQYILSERVTKHGTHDQKTHGNWATGTPQGSNGLSHREIYHLMAGSSDSKKPAVYRAEEKYQPAIQHKLEKPFPPSREKYLTGEMSKEEYDKAWKEYDKKFDEWSRETSRNIQSELGKQNLDGTRAGVQRFIDDVTKADWFVEAFGNGGVVRTPKVALRDNQVAGTYTIGTKNGVGYSAMVINKGFSLNEPTIIHEITHYATAVSARATYDPHGVEFAKNHIYIVSKVIGPEYAAGLEKAYREEGIDLG